jgi:hypothetical protein
LQILVLRENKNFIYQPKSINYLKYLFKFTRALDA